jgi:hypothetical protein
MNLKGSGFSLVREEPNRPAMKGLLIIKEFKKDNLRKEPGLVNNTNERPPEGIWASEGGGLFRVKSGNKARSKLSVIDR